MTRKPIPALLLLLTGGPPLAADTLPAAEDAQTSAQAPAANYGRARTLTVHATAAADLLDSYARFDLAALPPAASVQKAILRLYVSRAATPGPIEVAAVAAPWEESTITAGGAPAIGASAATFTVAAGDATRYVSVDVTGLVQDWVSGVADNHGLVLRGAGGQAVNVTFGSRESVRTSRPPELEVALGASSAVGPGAVGTVELADFAVTPAKLANGAVDGSKIADGSVGSGDVDSAAVQLRVTGTCAAGSSIRSVNQNGTVVCQPDATGADWGLGGNAGTNPATQFLGTTDSQPLELRANNLRVGRLTPRATTGTYQAPSVALGHDANAVLNGAVGATIGGGGGIYGGGALRANLVTSTFATVAGGQGNVAGTDGSNPTAGAFATVGGGAGNRASGGVATIGGGNGNTASADWTTVAGGYFNTASGQLSMVPGGSFNEAGGRNSFAAGYLAHVRTPAESGDSTGDEGTFIWSDQSALLNFTSTGANQFLIRAAGGVGINTNAPASALDVNGTATMMGFRLTSAPSAGRVLTSDANGNGTWLPVSGGDHDHAGSAWTAGLLRPALSVTNVEPNVSGANNTSGVHGAGVYGIFGESSFTYGRAVFGRNHATSGFADGVFGTSASANGRGVVGYVPVGTGVNNGVWGQSDSITGRGVFGLAAASSGENYGVYGQTNSPAGYAGYFAGRVFTDGSLDFGATTRQMINLWSNAYGIGVQSGTVYFRTGGPGGGFAWHVGGTHADAQNDPGGGVRQMRLDGGGNLFVRGTVNPGGADFAEMLRAEDALEPGDVLAIGPDGALVKSSEPYQPTVAGVYSTQPAFLGGAADGEDLTGKVPLAVVGVVPVKASAEAGPIRPGDRLVASATPGHAMRGGPEAPIGTVIGKALSALDAGTGVVKMLAVLQ